MKRKKRPIPIAFLSGYLILAGLLSPLFLLVSPSPDAIAILSPFPGIAGWIPRHFGAAGMMAASCIEFLVLGAIGIGLWRLKSWARAAIMVLSGLVACLSWFGFAYSLLSQRGFDIGNFAIGLLAGFLLYYLSRATVRSQFMAAAPSLSVS